ncbi:MAG: hypothetical protein KF849_17065 [Rhizobiaceae bacterium]|nr:hypothetical protein [Rhizobiaceae bacterium]
MTEISAWPIEAKEESSSGYFFHFGDVSLIEKGVKSYVIGRKGTGRQQSLSIYIEFRNTIIFLAFCLSRIFHSIRYTILLTEITIGPINTLQSGHM